MIYLDLLLGFLRVGCFAFGGAYGAIPLIREVVLSYGWISEEALTNMIAVSESTPGPIMVNMATYIGSTTGGFAGALVATTAVVLPSFVVILLVMQVLKNLLKYPATQAILRGMKPCIIGIILATGAQMIFTGVLPGGNADLRSLIAAGLCGGVWLLWERLTGKKLSPIGLIGISACIGVLIFGI